MALPTRQREAGDAVAGAGEEGADQRHDRGQAGEGEVDDQQVEAEGEAAGERAGALGRLGAALAEDDAARDPLDHAVEAPGHVADRVADVLDEADALGADRGAQLGRLGDPLDQALRLVAGQQAPPDLVDHLAVERLDQRLLHRVALQRAAGRFLDQRPLQDPHQGALDRLALDRGDHRLLGGGLDRAVDSRRLADRARSAHAGAEQPHRERQRGLRNRDRQPLRPSIRSRGRGLSRYPGQSSTA